MKITFSVIAVVLTATEAIKLKQLEESEDSLAQTELDVDAATETEADAEA